MGFVFVGRESDDYRLGSALDDTGGDGVSVDVSYLARGRLHVGWDEFVAGGNYGDSRFPENRNLCDAKRKQSADVLGTDCVSWAKQDVPGANVFADLNDILARRDWAQDLDGSVVGGLGALYHYYGVGVVSEGAARVGDSGFPHLQFDIGIGTGGNVGNDLQQGRQTLGGTECVAGAD